MIEFDIAWFYIVMLLAEYIADDGVCYVHTEVHMKVMMEILCLIMFLRCLWALYCIWSGRNDKPDMEFIYITKHIKAE